MPQMGCEVSLALFPPWPICLPPFSALITVLSHTTTRVAFPEEDDSSQHEIFKG